MGPTDSPILPDTSKLLIPGLHPGRLPAHVHRKTAPHYQPIHDLPLGLRPLPLQLRHVIDFSKQVFGIRDATGFYIKGIGSLSWWVAESGSARAEQGYTGPPTLFTKAPLQRRKVSSSHWPGGFHCLVAPLSSVCSLQPCLCSWQFSAHLRALHCPLCHLLGDHP